ncbi:MAG: response regulator, partial [Cyanobacteria bacterium J06635_13]
RLLIVKLLGQVGFEVREAENGQQALKLAQQWQPQLILMDMRMPIMDGYESTRKIRALEPDSLHAPCKIIALTASAFESKRAETIAAGCNDYLRKPFQENELFAKLQEHLDVKYIYQNDDNQTPATENSSPQLTSASLQGMPCEWRLEFKQAAAELNEARLEELIRQIPPEHQSIVQPLTDLVCNFQFEKLIELL